MNARNRFTARWRWWGTMFREIACYVVFFISVFFLLLFFQSKAKADEEPDAAAICLSAVMEDMGIVPGSDMTPLTFGLWKGYGYSINIERAPELDDETMLRLKIERLTQALQDAQAQADAMKNNALPWAKAKGLK